VADAMIKASKPMLEIRFSLLIATRVFENLTAPCPTIRTRARDEPTEMSCQCRGKRTIQPIVYMNIRETSQLFVRLLHKPHLSELADAAGLSAFHFAKLFKQSTGSSPHQYILQRRLERAKELLRNPQMSLSEVSQHTGFADQSHLTNVFRRFVGVTPAKFRRLL